VAFGAATQVRFSSPEGTLIDQDGIALKRQPVSSPYPGQMLSARAVSIFGSTRSHPRLPLGWAAVGYRCNHACIFLEGVSPLAETVIRTGCAHHRCAWRRGRARPPACRNLSSSPSDRGHDPESGGKRWKPCSAPRQFGQADLDANQQTSPTVASFWTDRSSCTGPAPTALVTTPPMTRRPGSKR